MSRGTTLVIVVGDYHSIVCYSTMRIVAFNGRTRISQQRYVSVKSPYHLLGYPLYFNVII